MDIQFENLNVKKTFKSGLNSIYFQQQKLLDAGGDKETLDNDEMTPVMWACHFDNHENVEVLLNISMDDEMRFEAVDSEVQDKDVNGKTLLHWSVSRSTSKQCFKVNSKPQCF